MKKRMIAFATFAASVTTLTFTSGCSDETHRPALALSTMEQNARDAEEAESAMHHDEPQKGHHGDKKAGKKAVKTSGKQEPKTVKNDAKTEKKSKSPKVAKHETRVETSTAPMTASVKTAKVEKSDRKPASKDSVYTVHVGAFRVKENAERMFAKVKGAGFPSTMKQMSHSKNGELYVVALEPTPNKTEAETWLNELKSKADVQGHIVGK